MAEITYISSGSEDSEPELETQGARTSAPEPGSRSIHKRHKHGTKFRRTIIIELTDSEADDDDDDGVLMLQNPQDHSVRPSSRGSNVTTLPVKRKRPSHSSHSLPLSRKKTPLFLPDVSDDEVSVAYQKAADRMPSPRRVLAVDDVDEFQATPRALSPSDDPVSRIVAGVLEIVPDVDLAHLNTLVGSSTIINEIDKTVGNIIDALLNDPTYPKIEVNARRKGANINGNALAGSSKNPDVDYEASSRKKAGGVHYSHLSLLQLQKDFPYVPQAYIRQAFASNKRFYAPTYMVLDKQERQFEQQKRVPGWTEKKSTLPYIRRKNPYRPQKTMAGSHTEKFDTEFDQERAWILEQIAKKDLELAEAINEEEYEDSGGGIECGCCFSTYPFDKMIQCPEAHLFCKSCIVNYASNLLGSHNTDIKCIHQSGCTLPIPASELSRCLPDKQMSLWERLKQKRELEKAGLAGWEECPFCDWGCVMEVSTLEQRLFRCENEDICGIVSCRTCKKPDHLPKTCKEVEQDKALEGRHSIEEAMTRALMRNCPKCQKPFIKDFGCNMMTCSCGAHSCYVCRKLVTYGHFSGRNSCSTAGSVEQLHAQEVKAAADTALEQYKQDHPEINEDEIKVDIPQVPALPAFRPLGGAAPGYWNMGLNMLFPGAGHALGMQQVLPGGPMGAWPRR